MEALLSNTVVARAAAPAGAARGNARAAALSSRPAKFVCKSQVSLSCRAARSPVVCSATPEPAPERVGSDPSKLGVNMPAALDINEIMNRLPHRFPFLLVDRVVEYVPGKYAIGIKNVTINDNFFPGHFPTRPLMPGVLQVEAMAQVGGLIMLNDEVGGSKDKFFFGGVDGCRFRRPVVPGDTLVMRVDLVKLQKRFGVAKMRAVAYVGDQLACEADLTMFLGS